MAVPEIPSGVEPGRLLKELEEPSHDLNRELKPLNIPGMPKDLILNHEFGFELKDIHIEGNTIFSKEALEEIYKEKIGKKVTFSELKEVSNKITLQYRNAGFVLAKAILPPQHIENGVVHIKVLQGNIENIAVEGKVKHVQSLLEAYAKEAGSTVPFNIASLERYALLSNDIPGVTVKTLLSPSKNQPGASDLTFMAELQRTEGMLGVDNRGTRYLGPVQYLIRGNVNSACIAGDSLGLRTLMAKNPNELGFVQLYYQHPFGKKGITGAISMSHVYSHPGAALKPLFIKGIANSLGYELSYPYLRTREKTLLLSIGFDVLDSKTDLLGTRLLTDHIRSICFTTTYLQEDRWSGTNTLRGSFSQGLPILSANPKHAANVSRIGGRSNYSKLLLSLSRLQALKRQFSFFTDFRLQYALTRLLAPEQFSYGGLPFGSAYDPSELTGDAGLVGKFELRYTTESKISPQILKILQPYVFYDIGVIWSPVQVARQHKVSATSTGFGMRIHFTSKTYLQGEVAQPLTRPAAVKELHGKGPRIFASLNHFF